MNNVNNTGNEMLIGGYNNNNNLGAQMQTNSMSHGGNPNPRIPPPKPPRVGRPTTQEIRDVLSDSLKRRASTSPPQRSNSLNHDRNRDSRGLSGSSGSSHRPKQGVGINDQTFLREPLNSDWGNLDVSVLLLLFVCFFTHT